MNIALCQYNIAWEDKKTNREQILSLTESSGATRDVDWMVFPETTLTGFSPGSARSRLSEEDFDFFRNLAVRCGCALTFGGFHRRQNLCVTLDRRGKMMARAAKIHLFTHSGEQKHCRPGNRVVPFSVSGMRVTPVVCYDLRFSYLFWDNAEKTDLFLVIANWPAVRQSHWRTLLEARAIENQAYVVGVNRIGESPHGRYEGGSAVIDPAGRTALDCGAQEGIFITEVSRERVVRVRSEFPVIPDRKPRPQELR